jgi:tetratricopeptide (TPR) repeat protein
MPEGQDNDSTSLPPRAQAWWTAALILGLTLACYWPSLQGGFLWDDDGHVTRPELQPLSGLGQIWFNVHATQQYYPLLHSAFWMEHRLWGDATLGYHLVNVLLHASAACLLVLILRRLRLPGAVLAGVIFAVHPVCVESVAWISEQKNTLSLVLYLLAALAYLRFDGDRERPGAGRCYWLASVLFVMALLTKTVTATLPAALLVVFWWKRGRIAWHHDVRPLVPWFVAAGASGAVTAWVERTIIGAEGSAFTLSFLDRCLLAGRVVWFYLGKLLWPAHLSFVYPRWDAKSEAAGWSLFLLATLLVTAGLWAYRRRSRGPLAAWLFYVGSLFPALGFFNVYPFVFSYVADHFQYLASMGVIAAFSAEATTLINRSGQAARASGMALVAASVAGLAIVTNAQSQAYADEPTLYKATLEENPAAWMAHNNLGLWYRNHGEPEKALKHYKEALRLRSDYPQAHNNLGVLYEDKGEMEAAAAQFRAALATAKDYVAAKNNLGNVLGKMEGHLGESVDQLRETVRLQPDFADAHNNLGAALSKMPGHIDEAIAQYKEALRLQPNLAAAHANLGEAYSDMPDRLTDAIAEYQESLRLQPDDAAVRSNLGMALNAQGRPAEAIIQYNEALRLKPSAAEIRFNMALALLTIPGREGEAAGQLEEFLRERPGNPTALQLLNQIRGGGP